MFATMTVPSPGPLRAAAFDLLASSPSIPADILAESMDHQFAVRAVLLELADAAESEPLVETSRFYACRIFAGSSMCGPRSQQTGGFTMKRGLGTPLPPGRNRGAER
jgi:hypothetical protein